jgi:2,4-dienoyl-CoA reductase-like NADH-dependent reductase (Old Yellow Enzyme family)
MQVGDFPILIKINCDDHVKGGIGLDSFPELAGEIERTGVDAIEVSGGMWDCLVRPEEELGFIPAAIPEARTRINTPERQTYFLRYVENLRLSVPILLVGGNRNIERMENILHEGYVSFFSLCRPLINEPALPRRWLEGQGKETADCVSCNGCMLTLMKDSVSCLLKKNKLQQAGFKSISRIWKMFWK